MFTLSSNGKGKQKLLFQKHASRNTQDCNCLILKCTTELTELYVENNFKLENTENSNVEKRGVQKDDNIYKSDFKFEYERLITVLISRKITQIKDPNIQYIMLCSLRFEKLLSLLLQFQAVQQYLQ
jgi:hypothetical protein